MTPVLHEPSKAVKVEAALALIRQWTYTHNCSGLLWEDYVRAVLCRLTGLSTENPQ